MTMTFTKHNVPQPVPIKKRRRSSKSVYDRGSSGPEKAVELRKKDLNVNAGRIIYERASSRHERHRRTLMEQTHISRDTAIPLSRGGVRGPGLAELTVKEPDCRVHERDEELKRGVGIPSYPRPVVPQPRPRIMGRSQRLLSGGITKKDQTVTQCRVTSYPVRVMPKFQRT